VGNFSPGDREDVYLSKMAVRICTEDASGVIPLNRSPYDALKLMYEFFQRQVLRASEADFPLQAKVLGHLPRSFHMFLRETVAAWMPHEHREYAKVG